MGIVITILINVISLYVVSYLMPGVSFVDFRAIFVSALLLAIANKFIKPVLHFIFLPLTIITFGIAAFFVNVIILIGVSRLVPGFHIDSFLTAILSSLLITLVSIFLKGLDDDED